MTSRPIVFLHATLLALTVALVGCGSVTPLQPGPGAAGAGGRDASTEDAPQGKAGAGGGTGAAGSGVAGGAGGNVPLGYCDKEDDCVLNDGCCSGSCDAKTDPVPVHTVCTTECVAGGLGPSTCGCVDHRCSSASRCVVPGTGLCPYCPNGYQTGPDGCQTCDCLAGDAGSPGSVTLRLTLPQNRSFCDEASSCNGVPHITILTTDGKPVGVALPQCATLCGPGCQPAVCAGIACFEEGVAVKSSELTWNGSTYGEGTCADGASCYQPGSAPPGAYVAQMCATAGTLSTPDGGFAPVCTQTAGEECVRVPFDFPGTDLVEGKLP